MEREKILENQVNELVAKIKADPKTFHDYVKNKPERLKETIAKVKKIKEERKQKALNELYI